jgi:predicted phosphodiesterase
MRYGMAAILGMPAIADALKAFKPLRAVYGNIDGYDISGEFPEELIFMCEDVKVFIKHIGGYPGRYAPGVKNIIIKEKPQLFISGHSIF